MGRIHFIAIGGSAMHNLAIALHLSGYEVSGSDDEIFDPAKSRLAQYGLLPAAPGWFPEKIDRNLEAVILGMHAREDNPELLQAKALGIKIYSYPEYLYEQSKNQRRVVIGGSHGKTTVTAMILHVHKGVGMNCNYMVGAPLAGFDVMVRLDPTAPVMVIEGDEYLTSPIDRRPKFHLYHPHIAVINGIAWDHINVFPTFDIYTEQFDIFARSVEQGGQLIYYTGDPEVKRIGERFAAERPDARAVPYQVPAYRIADGITYWHDTPLQVFGRHNLQNIEAAKAVCLALGVAEQDFVRLIADFHGASRRLERIADSAHTTVFKDFAHSPSKLEATIGAVKEQFPARRLVACMELHTFSSLSREFLSHYKGCMDKADVAMVYFNPKAIAHKKLPPITDDMVFDGFARQDLQVYHDSAALTTALKSRSWRDTNLLWMTSGNFDGVDERALAQELALE